jgi:predicted nucleic acid-binding protein
VVDPTDAPHVAVALEIDGLLWTGDEQLKDELREQGFDRFYDPE